jgi:hypothetical protein
MDLLTVAPTPSGVSSAYTDLMTVLVVGIVDDEYPRLILVMFEWFALLVLMLLSMKDHFS